MQLRSFDLAWQMRLSVSNPCSFMDFSFGRHAAVTLFLLLMLNSWFTSYGLACKHIFALLHYTHWTWDNLPVSVRSDPRITLDVNDTVLASVLDEDGKQRAPVAEEKKQQQSGDMQSMDMEQTDAVIADGGDAQKARPSTPHIAALIQIARRHLLDTTERLRVTIYALPDDVYDTKASVLQGVAEVIRHSAEELQKLIPVESQSVSLFSSVLSTHVQLSVRRR